MSILVTGGSGKTSLILCRMLEQAKIPFWATSRKGQAGVPQGIRAVKFDWYDQETFKPALEQDNFSAAYLVAPYNPKPIEQMASFIDQAIAKGVKRFVLCAGGVSL